MQSILNGFKALGKAIVMAGLASGFIALLASPSFAEDKVDIAVPEEEINDALWPDLRSDIFEERKIIENPAWLSIKGPYRAHDAALVPIVIHSMPLKPGQYIKALTIIIDNNPVPIAAKFELSKKVGPLHIETRLRINQYSYVRAVVETNDGQLYMVSKYVKASGGCSAPASKDAEAKMAALGRMKLRQFSKAAKNPGRSTIPQREVQLMVRHPNFSGLQQNQETGYYIPAHYVEKIIIKLDGEQLMKIDGAISLSEDPTLRFRFLAQTDQPEIQLIVLDTKKQQFEKKWRLKAQDKVGS